MFVTTKFFNWITGKILNSPRDTAPEIFIYCNADHAIVTPTICFKTFRGPAHPSEVIAVPFEVSLIAQAVFKKIGECRWCENEAEFDGAVAEFFTSHKIKGWNALPRVFEHIAIRQVNEESMLITCYEHRSEDGYSSEKSPLAVPASTTAIESALVECFDSLGITLVSN